MQIRAVMVADVTDYPWSSYRATAGLPLAPEWLMVDWIRTQFGKTAAVAQRRYTDFVAQGLTAPSPWSQLKGQTLLGSESLFDSQQDHQGRAINRDIKT